MSVKIKVNQYTVSRYGATRPSFTGVSEQRIDAIQIYFELWFGLHQLLLDVAASFLTFFTSFSLPLPSI